jgi:filamentous hemagglutinin family protein
MSYDIAYVIEDAATVTGLTLITKRNRDYSLGRLFSVGNTVTGTFSWFALLDGASMESDNNIGATDRAFQIEGDGRWDFGYEQADAGVPGGYLITTANADGEYGFEAVAGADIRAYQLFITSVENTRFLLVDESRGSIDGLQIYKNLYNSVWEGNVDMANVVVQGVGTANEYMEIDESYDVDGILGIATDGFLPSAITTGTVRGYQSVGNNQDITMPSDAEGLLVRFVNPLWDGDYPVLVWTAATGTVQERFDYNTEVRNPAGAPLADARLYLYDGFDQDFQSIASSNVTGSIPQSALARAWESGTAGTAPTQVRGPFVQRMFRFTQSPFEGAITIDSPINQTVTLVDDNIDIDGAPASRAAADSSTAQVNELGTGTPGNLIAYDNGVSLLVPTNIVVGATSGATGTARDITGDAADGTLFLHNRNGIAFIDGEDLEVGGSFVSTANLTSGTGGLDLDFHWEVRGDENTSEEVYAWQASQSDKDPAAQWVLEMAKHRVRLLERSGSNFFTERVDGEGVYYSERVGSDILYLTSDENWQWTPPVQFTLTLTDIENPSEVRIYANVGGEAGDELAGSENVSGTFTYDYEYGGSDINVIAVIFHLNFLAIRQFLVLSNENSTVPIQQNTDRVYSNP